ncbi:hypothetical protein [Fusibacter bizertensis]
MENQVKFLLEFNFLQYSKNNLQAWGIQCIFINGGPQLDHNNRHRILNQVIK